jgi:hypothetical protein
MDSLEATKKALRDHESIQNEEVAYLYVENFADRVRAVAQARKQCIDVATDIRHG